MPTRETQSVCKHCEKEIVQCVDYRPHKADNCKGYVHDEVGAPGHNCVIDGAKTDLLAEPASTGEPPPDSVKLVGTRQPTEAEIEYGKTLDPMAKECLERNKARMERAARPSEPSAPKCDCNAGKNARLYEHHRDCHWLQFVTRPENNPSAPQTSAVAGKKHYIDCPHCGERNHIMTWQDATPKEFLGCHYCRKPLAAPQPVSGDAPKVEEIILRAVDKCNPSTDGERFCLYNIIETAINESRRYFPPASQTQGLIGLNEQQLEVIAKWAADSPHNIWGNAEVRDLNLRTFARAILSVATPASTARKWTDALGDYRNDLARDVTCQEGAAFKAGFLAAAPGSVPPLKVQIVTPEELERQQSDPTNYMCGVPQAEPPKEEKRNDESTTRS